MDGMEREDLGCCIEEGGPDGILYDCLSEMI